MQLQNTTFLVPDDGLSPWWKALPFDFQDVRVSVGARPMGFRFSKSIIDIEATLDGITILACGESDTDDLAMTKAIMELVERAKLMMWHREHGTHATSNGWAAHSTLQNAKTNAILELVERDAVLAQWYLSKPFLEIKPDSWPEEIKEWVRSELAQSEFPKLKLLLSTEGFGPSVTCLFMNDAGLGVSGHGTKLTLEESVNAAIAETCRAAHHAIRRSFWKDTQILLNRTPSARVDPGTHAVFYAYHEPFPNWMFGQIISWDESATKWNDQIIRLLGSEVDGFKFNVVSEDPATIGFAEHSRALELTWGTTDIQKVLKQMKARMPSILMEERNLNSQPHIVS